MSTITVKGNYLEPAVANDYDSSRFTSAAGRWFDRLERRAIHRTLAPLLPKLVRQPVLDAPCGTGRITHALLNMGLHVVGGDISPAMIQVAADRCRAFTGLVQFYEMDLDHLELPDNYFELVTCIRLLHHLDTDARTAILTELARVSRRYVLVNVSFSSPWYRLRRTVKRMLGQGVSRQSSSRRQINAEAAAAGLRPVARRFVLRGASEDLILLFEKAPTPAPRPIPRPQPSTLLPGFTSHQTYLRQVRASSPKAPLEDLEPVEV